MRVGDSKARFLGITDRKQWRHELRRFNDVYRVGRKIGEYTQ